LGPPVALDSAFPSAIRFNRHIPPKLEDIISKALEKDRNLRYQNAADVLTDLQRLKRDMETGRVPSASSGTVATAQESGISQVGTAAAVETERSPAVSAGVLAPPEDGVRTHALVRPYRAKLRPLIAAIALVAAATAGGLSYRSHRAKPLTDRDTIVLGDLSNSTGDPVFDDTLKTALGVSLRQSPFLNVLSDSDLSKTLRLMTRPPDTKLTPDVAREVCRPAGSKAYIAGSIASLGSQYVVGLKAIISLSEIVSWFLRSRCWEV
jgi:eukaryotic-like serine/threonine-protein kinase